jgi:SAM-dependent methyltransferase
VSGPSGLEAVPGELHEGTNAGLRSWFEVDGRLPSIDFTGDSDFRYPDALVETVVDAYSKPGDHVLDPFCGFGTTLRVCARMNRPAVGFERDNDIYRYASRFVAKPHRLYHDRAENISSYRLPPFDLVVCSPPFRSFRHDGTVDPTHYYDDLLEIFRQLLPALRPGAFVVVETVNLTDGAGRPIPRAFQTALELSTLLDFQREHICCQTAGAQVTPGYDHSYLLVFRNRCRHERERG